MRQKKRQSARRASPGVGIAPPFPGPWKFCLPRRGRCPYLIAVSSAYRLHDVYGKTMIALGLGLRAVDEGHTVAFEKMESFVDILDKADVDRKAGLGMRYLRRAQLVIVDEIGYTPIRKDQANRFLSFVSDAYERASMVFTTNKEITQWEEPMGDQVLTTAMLDRILHHARCFSLRGESYRLKHPELYASERQG